MKKISVILFSATLVLFQSCQSNEQPKEETNTAVVAGADTDSHGCKASAGYTWSELKQNCIRIFEDGEKMTVADSTLDQTTAAFAVFNADSSKVELFIPSVSNGIILSKTDTGNWADSVYVFSAKGQQFEIQKGKSLLYKK